MTKVDAILSIIPRESIRTEWPTEHEWSGLTTWYYKEEHKNNTDKFPKTWDIVPHEKWKFKALFKKHNVWKLNIKNDDTWIKVQMCSFITHQLNQNSFPPALYRIPVLKTTFRTQALKCMFTRLLC